MTDLRQAMQMALVQMEKNQWFVADMAKHVDVMAFNSVMEVLRAQLERQEQEPVAMEQCSFPKCQTTGGCVGACTRPIQPVSPQRKPLTHEQAKALVAKYGDDPLNLVFQTEAAHGIGEEL